MNIAELFHAKADINNRDYAIIAFSKQSAEARSAFEIEAASRMYAEKLREAGLQPGDTVLVFYPMSLELYVALLAIFRLGMTAMFIDPSAGKEHIERCCELHPPQALIASTKAHLLRLVSPAMRRIPRKFVIGLPVFGAKLLQGVGPPVPFLILIGVFIPFWIVIGFWMTFIESIRAKRRWRTMSEEEIRREPALVEAWQEAVAKRREYLTKIIPVSDDHPALITFTSGSTGQPKAAVRSHGFLRAQHRVLEKSLSLTAGEIDLTTLPIFVIANLASGVQSIIPPADLRFPGAIDPQPIVQRINKMKPVSTAASPAFLERIADYCLSKNIQLTCFQKIFTGGAPVFPRLLDKLQTIAPNARVVAVYGSTEAEPIAEITHSEINEDALQAMLSGRGLLTGKPVPDIQLRILRDHWGTPIRPLTQTEFDADCLPINEPGEIVVTGEHVLTGYLHGRGDEETKFTVNGKIWHRTGDAGYVDAQGRLWLLGRCSAKITDARGTLFPFAVECAASHQQGIKRAALVQHQGKRLLTIELNGKKCSLDELAKTLAWASLDEIRVVKTIPVDKRHNAKVDYPALAKILD